ncbi:hypothetical protein WN944_019359 [Citrus x changshan-huyou]|uniref:Uncharacterized protein n=1 Tax=Citrus x changshan-huyou TaxID=2935761 RepID=A0AAP0LYG0_9ROSI
MLKDNGISKVKLFDADQDTMTTLAGSDIEVMVAIPNKELLDMNTYWMSIHEDIGAHLRQAVVVKERVEVYEPMRHFVFAAPVNMAPVLLVHSCKPNTELLVADAMLPFGLELLASSDNPAGNNSGRILRVMVEMTRAMGSQGVVEGQYNELQCSQCDEMMIGN